MPTMLYYTKCQRKKDKSVEMQTHNSSDVINSTLKEGIKNPCLSLNGPCAILPMRARQSFLEAVTSTE